MQNPDYAYFITFRTYGTWLHGDERGSTSRKRNRFNTPMITAWAPLKNVMMTSMCETEFTLSNAYSNTVLKALIETCQYNMWKLYAAHVRKTHLHIVLSASLNKEKTLATLKCYATKALKKQHSELI